MDALLFTTLTFASIAGFILFIVISCYCVTQPDLGTRVRI